MSERFEKLYKLKANLYSENAPIIVSACVLLKDSQTNKIITQIKFQSISKETIQAVKISLNAYDISAKQIEGVDEFQYLDLRIKNGDYFGQNKAIIMPDSVVRSIEINKITIIFENNTKNEIAGNNLVSIDSFEKIVDVIGDNEIIKQYQIDSATSALYVPKEYSNLWICPCGKINSSDICTSCNSKKDIVFSAYDITLLKEHSDIRLTKEKEEEIKQAELKRIKEKEQEERIQREQEQKAKEDAERKRKITIYSIIAGVIIIAIIILSAVNSFVQKKNAIADIDSYLSEHQYEHAFDRLNQSNLSDVDKKEYLNKLKPLMNTQRNTVDNSYSQVLNIDGMIIWEEDDSLYYIDEDDKKNIIYKMSEWEEEQGKFIRDDFIYANGYIFFVETKKVYYNGDYDYEDFVKCIDIEIGSEKTIDSYCDFYQFYKLKDGKILIDLYYSDIIFNPYNGTIKEGKDIVSEEMKNNSIYKTD